MLAPAPYKAPKKKAKKEAKETRGSLHRKGTSDVTSEDEETRSSFPKDDEEEEEEEIPPRDEGREKRAASTNLEVGTPKKRKGSLADNSVWDVDSSPERRSRAKP